MKKSEIDRLGKTIGKSIDISKDDLNKLQEFRQTFQVPISNVFNYVLKAAREIDNSCIVTYRIKRIDTIVEKLRRFYDNPNGRMNLSRMWDIAGCRCILNTTKNDKLYMLLKKVQDEYGKECKVKDYVVESKESGYRSIHIYVKDHFTQKPVEIQIRNMEHHNWATLVEIVDLLYGTKNKEHGAESKLGRFLLLYSNAKDLTNEEFSEMIKIERKFKVFEMMSKVLTRNYLNIRTQWSKQKNKGNFFVITANKKGSEIVSFQTFKEAENAYYEKYILNSDSNIVLTHLKEPDFNQISKAYSNYVLAMHAFFDDYRALVAQKIILCIKYMNYFKFVKYIDVYKSNVKCHFENLSLEVNSMLDCNNDSSISKSQIKKWIKEIKKRLILWGDESKNFLTEIVGESNRNPLNKLFVKWGVKQLQIAINEGLSLIKN